MRTEIKKLHQRVGKTTIYVTHDQIEAMTLASRIAVMHRGEVQQFDEPETVYNNPVNIFVAGFMGSPSMNFLPAEIADDAGRLVIAVANGDETARLPLGREPGKSIHPGRSVVFGVRPEHMALYRGDESRTVGKIDALVEVVEPTGAETIASLRIGDNEVTARFQPDAAPREGEKVTLAVDVTKTSLFDPQSEQSL
jgi:multiple sugar transport system ATP-binding protein